MSILEFNIISFLGKTCKVLKECAKIDLILDGHAHDGQIRIRKRGLFAPDQGLFPRYVSGLYDDRMLVSRGIANVAKHIPRINNAREVIYIYLLPENSAVES